MKMMMMTIKDGGWSLFSGGCLATGIMGNGVWIGLCGYTVGFLEMGQWGFFFFHRDFVVICCRLVDDGAREETKPAAGIWLNRDGFKTSNNRQSISQTQHSSQY